MVTSASRLNGTDDDSDVLSSTATQDDVLAALDRLTQAVRRRVTGETLRAGPPEAVMTASEASEGGAGMSSTRAPPSRRRLRVTDVKVTARRWENIECQRGEVRDPGDDSSTVCC